MFKDGTNIERDSKKITKINMKFSLIFFKSKIKLDFCDSFAAFFM